jgi:hypothetical protein
MSNKKKELTKDYKQNHRPMGVFQIRNTVNGKVFVAGALDLPGIMNSQKFQLSMGGHRTKTLQAEWQQYGAESFVFEILDEITPTQNPGYEYREELKAMQELWLEKLEPYGDRGYNERKLGTEERLKLMAQNRSGTH